MGNNREYTKVIRYICSLIESGDLRMGERLPTERAISETLSISATPPVRHCAHWNTWVRWSAAKAPETIWRRTSPVRSLLC